MLASVARIRSLIVSRTILKSPLLRRVLQQCVNPRKSKVSGLRMPRSRHCCVANRPKRINRVFVGMQLQSKVRHSLLQCSQKTSCFPLTLESQHTVIGIANDNHVAGRMSVTPLLRP